MKRESLRAVHVICRRTNISSRFTIATINLVSVAAKFLRKLVRQAGVAHHPLQQRNAG